MTISPASIPSPLKRRVLLAVSPNSQRKLTPAGIARLMEAIENKGFQVASCGELDEVARRANTLHSAGELRALIGVGGDGTAAELINRTMPGVPFAMFPAGNENLFARHLKMPREPMRFADVIATGGIRQIDAGLANGRIFLLVAGCGFDAEVVRRLHSRRTGPVGRISYIKPILDSIRTYGYPELRIEWAAAPSAAETWPRQCRWLFVFNLPRYGGGFQIAPQADGSDGLLDVCTLRRGGLIAGLRYAMAIGSRMHQRMADFQAVRSTSLRVTADVEVPYQLDGDPGGVLPVEISVLPARLTCLVPRSPGSEPSNP